MKEYEKRFPSNSSITLFIMGFFGGITGGFIAESTGITLGMLSNYIKSRDDILEDFLELTREEKGFSMEIFYKYRVIYNPAGSIESDKWFIKQMTLLSQKNSKKTLWYFKEFSYCFFVNILLL